MSIFHQHSHSPAKYCSSIILPPGFELGCLRWGIGALPIRYSINLSTKQLLKRYRLTFRIIQSARMSTPLFGIIFTLAYVYLHRFQVHISLMRHLPCGLSFPCPVHNLGRTNKKPFTGLIGPIHFTIRRAVTRQSWVTRCSPRVPVFRPGIYIFRFIIVTV